jgi:hypothetical protein
MASLYLPAHGWLVVRLRIFVTALIFVHHLRIFVTALISVEEPQVVDGVERGRVLRSPCRLITVKRGRVLRSHAISFVTALISVENTKVVDGVDVMRASKKSSPKLQLPAPRQMVSKCACPSCRVVWSLSPIESR